MPLGPVPLTLSGRSACLGSNQNVRSHDFRHAFDELEDILPYPSCRNFIGGKRLIRAVNTRTLMSTSGPPSSK